MTDTPPPEHPEGQAETPYPSYPSYPTNEAGMPAYPMGTDTPAAPVERPSSIQLAVKGMYVGAAFSLLGIIVGLLTLSTVKDNIASKLRDNGTYSQSKLDTAYNSVVVTIIIGGIIAFGLWLWMARANGNGRAWARIVATVLGVINLLGSLLTLGQGQETALGLLISVLSALLAIAIIVLMWRGESTAYYKASAKPKHS